MCVLKTATGTLIGNSKNNDCLLEQPKSSSSPLPPHPHTHTPFQNLPPQPEKSTAVFKKIVGYINFRIFSYNDSQIFPHGQFVGVRTKYQSNSMALRHVTTQPFNPVLATVDVAPPEQGAQE